MVCLNFSFYTICDTYLYCNVVGPAAAADAGPVVRRNRSLRCGNPDRDCLWPIGVAYRALLCL